MIGYDRLGTNGRFGNQLFQYAALRGIAAHHGYDWCIPPEDHPTYANYGMHHPFKLQHLKNVGFVNSNNSPQAMFSYENIKQLNSTPNVKESVYYFDKEMFDNFEDGSNLDGFCQTEKYFKHIENENQSLSSRDGSIIYNKFSIELRYPITLKPSASIYTLAFLEAGNGYNSFREFNPFNSKRSAGVGVRIFMPAFGLLGIDFGYGFDNPAFGILEPNGWETHFLIGQQF